ncbi:hypothetical protein MKX01_028506 [Papaver californicum]|nr:hypothetical protein MKX01_028506 [Papaver californicum]
MAGSGSEKVKILGGWAGWPSPFVMRPRIAPNIKSVKYDFLNNHLVVKIHGGKPICKSMNIVQYIDDFLPSLYRIAKSKDAEEYKAAIKQVTTYQKTRNGKDFFGEFFFGYSDIFFGCYIGSIEVAERMNGIKLFN